MNGIMIQGTASNVGKSMICTAFCRLFANDGFHVAPFKSQNMSTFSTKIAHGLEISTAQFAQAEAAKVSPLPQMNPILLKPSGHMSSEVWVLGEKVEHMSGTAYRESFYDIGVKVIKQSLDFVDQNFDVVVLEGAGSPVEVNLTDRELVNMSIAELADVPVLLVADIERGGVFASIVGTLELLPQQHRNRVKGIIINKFRGDKELFNEGVSFIESYTGIAVLGVIPFMDNHQIEEEDSFITHHDTSFKMSGEDKYDEWAKHVANNLDWQKIINMVERP
ncbi:cobyric acid synthase [Paenisporosarcina sp. TG20]|uniref:cobyric acid synthase n=1 Tax=Paenisporosarcina sp. TG20 TaxID=1211706 RepID=UPI0003087942|nr:cobyric acid synthase [Paenisporosarcina sp. TG20]